MPLQATSGAASYDAFGGGVPVEPVYIESIFSTWLYTGNDSTQTIPNGIDLSTKGGLVWTKTRNVAQSHQLVDTVRGQASMLISNSTNAASVNSGASSVNSFLTTGYVAGVDFSDPTRTYVSWTFREQPKFFDMVTWTGSNDVNTNTGKGIIPHNLGSVPGCVIIKNVTQGATNWIVYHRSLSGGFRVLLNTTDAQTNSGSVAYFSRYDNTLGWVQTNPDANNIYVGYNFQTNGVGDTIVAYVFAHNAGGFGLTGTDNVISCGSFTQSSGSNVTVNLGYEPQLVMYKRTDASGDWVIADIMRGMAVSDGAAGTGSPVSALRPNSSGAEVVGYGYISPTATGFDANIASPATYIYIAIRRGPMKTPTTGTSVFTPVTYTGNAAAERTITSAVNAPDFSLTQQRNRAGWTNSIYDRLRGNNRRLITSSTAAESGANGLLLQNGITLAAVDDNNASGIDYINYFFQRAPGFFDQVCYTGTGVAKTESHNLGVAPELMIVKSRAGTGRDWAVYIAPMGNNYFACLNDGSFQGSSSAFWNDTTPTSSVFTVGTNLRTNNSGQTYVAHLFASCPGVSKVGSYTGTGTTQQINCGFTAGARFVLIKRTDSAGDWYVWDSARGIVAGNDPYLLLNSTAAEVTNTDFVDTAATGFEISSTAPAAINASGGTFLFLAIA